MNGKVIEINIDKNGIQKSSIKMSTVEVIKCNSKSIKELNIKDIIGICLFVDYEYNVEIILNEQIEQDSNTNFEEVLIFTNSVELNKRELDYIKNKIAKLINEICNYKTDFEIDENCFNLRDAEKCYLDEYIEKIKIILNAQGCNMI